MSSRGFAKKLFLKLMPGDMIITKDLGSREIFFVLGPGKQETLTVPVWDFGEARRLSLNLFWNGLERAEIVKALSPRPKIKPK